ncbi:hypothetical protein MtrunA17_Chr1g0192941 [Medicago truncatula]|uniref:Uncharacterized protein n=1 Tax=Medicago truncatula TaxID=3880 RepID=A0A396JUE0_MEDTR|nr:hypothetical protein MtrunA17_Chr1g0192941 [Medicago truncatula]
MQPQLRMMKLHLFLEAPEKHNILGVPNNFCNNTNPPAIIVKSINFVEKFELSNIISLWWTRPNMPDIQLLSQRLRIIIDQGLILDDKPKMSL